MRDRRREWFVMDTTTIQIHYISRVHTVRHTYSTIDTSSRDLVPYFWPLVHIALRSNVEKIGNLVGPTVIIGKVTVSQLRTWRLVPNSGHISQNIHMVRKPVRYPPLSDARNLSSDNSTHEFSRPFTGTVHFQMMYNVHLIHWWCTSRQIHYHTSTIIRCKNSSPDNPTHRLHKIHKLGLPVIPAPLRAHRVAPDA